MSNQPKVIHWKRILSHSSMFQQCLMISRTFGIALDQSCGKWKDELFSWGGTFTFIIIEEVELHPESDLYHHLNISTFHRQETKLSCKVMTGWTAANCKGCFNVKWKTHDFYHSEDKGNIVGEYHQLRNLVVIAHHPLLGNNYLHLHRTLIQKSRIVVLNATMNVKNHCFSWL